MSIAGGLGGHHVELILQYTSVLGLFVGNTQMEKIELQDLVALIRRRRSQLIVHSYIYYHCDQNVVSDHEWQDWANELVELQKQVLYIGYYDKYFYDWTGASGNELPVDKWVMEKAWVLWKIDSTF